MRRRGILDGSFRLKLESRSCAISARTSGSWRSSSVLRISTHSSSSWALKGMFSKDVVPCWMYGRVLIADNSLVDGPSHVGFECYWRGIIFAPSLETRYALCYTFCLLLIMMFTGKTSSSRLPERKEDDQELSVDTPGKVTACAQRRLRFRAKIVHARH